MPTPEDLQATVEQLNQEQGRELLYLLRRRFHWYVEMFDFEDGKQWWDEQECGPFTPEAWLQVVDTCDRFTEHAAGDAVYYAVESVAHLWATKSATAP